MDLRELLTHHAKVNVWCSPAQDCQAILKLARISPFGGAKGYLEAQWDKFKLPVEGQFFHVYQIGQNNPFELGLFPHRGVWIKLSDLATQSGLVANVYNELGIQYPLSETYVCRTHTKNFLVALRELPRKTSTDDPLKADFRIMDLDRTDIYLRLYSNAYYGTDPKTQTINDFKCNGVTVVTQQDISALQIEIQELIKLPGSLFLYLNGRLTNNISAARVTVGDNIEYLYDPSVEAVVDFPVKDLTAFNSELDKLQKYILHPEKRGDARIFYNDDIDVYLYQTDASGNMSGAYFYRNDSNSLRNLTHRDYSIPSMYIERMLSINPDWTKGKSDLKVRLYIRNSGYNRPLVYESGRLHEIYKLSDNKILRAFQGLDSVVPEWIAKNLETSWYVYLMRCWESEITSDRVISAYGYNAISKLVAESPLKVIPEGDGHKYVELGWGLRKASTMYEYDQDGLLLGFYHHHTGNRYFTQNENCALVEGIMGYGSSQPTIWFGKDDVELDPLVGYKFYVSDVVDGETVNNWKEITNPDGLYHIEDGVVKWDYLRNRNVCAALGDNRFLAYSLYLKQTDGFFRFHINYTSMQGIVCEVPFGKLELWLNNRSLIENIDYFVNWPEVCIINKEWLIEDGVNRIDVRCTEWANADGTLIAPNEFGYVYHGLLSTDEVYNIRDDKVIRCVADGRVWYRDDLVFSEQSYGVTVKAPIDDGRPYWITNVRVPIRGLTPYNTDQLRQQAEIVDKRVGDYMSVQVKDPSFETPSIIKRRYRVFSPLISKLISDINDGWFTPPTMPVPDKTVMDSLKDYLYILKYDPAHYDFVDDRYVTIHPHPWWKTVDVKQNTYAYLERVISIYLGSRVDLTQFVTIRG